MDNKIISITKKENSDLYNILFKDENDNNFNVSGKLIGNFERYQVEFSEDLFDMDFLNESRDIIESEHGRFIKYTFTPTMYPTEDGDNFITIGVLKMYSLKKHIDTTLLTFVFEDIESDDEPELFDKFDFNSALNDWLDSEY